MMTYHPLQIIIGLLLIIFPSLLVVVSGSTSSPAIVHHKKLDLSYLHRTKSTLLASAIRQTLKKEQQQQLEAYAKLGQVQEAEPEIEGRLTNAPRLLRC